MGRPSGKQVIDDNLDRIKEWVAAGLPMKDIASKLGIAERTLYKYKSEDPNFMQSVKNARGEAVERLEHTLFESATGFTRMVKKYEKVKRCEYENGKKVYEWEEMVEYEEEVYFKPDTGAGIFLLKNWADYKDNPALYELRKKEVALQEKKHEDSGWS